MSIVISELINYINEFIGRVWTIIVAPALILLTIISSTITREAYQPDIIMVTDSVLYAIGFTPAVVMGLVFTFILAKYDDLWRVVAYGWIGLAYAEITIALSLYISPYSGFGYICDTIVADLGIVVSLYLIYSGLITIIDNYYSSRAELTEVPLTILLAILTAVVMHLTPLFLYLMGYNPAPTVPPLSRPDLILGFMGWFATFILSYELFLRIRRTIYPDLVSVCFIAAIMGLSYFYIDFIQEYYYGSFFTILFMHSLSFVIILITMLLILYSTYWMSVYLKPIYRSVKEGVKGENHVLLEYGLSNPIRTRTMLLILLNRIINGLRNVDTIIYISYFGNPHITIAKNISIANGVRLITVYVLRGVGYPRYDSTYDAYVTTLDHNLLRLVYERVAGSRTVLILDNASHFITLYGVEKVYVILSEFIKSIRDKDLFIIMLNREMHTKKELAYMRNLAQNIIGLP